VRRQHSVGAGEIGPEKQQDARPRSDLQGRTPATGEVSVVDFPEAEDILVKDDSTFHISDVERRLKDGLWWV
jgi:hypothetical protein